MGIIGWIIFGLIVGAVAKFLMPGRDPGGWIVTILLGIAGALVGGFLGRAVGWYGPNDAAGFLMALVGALVLLGLYRLTLRRSPYAPRASGGARRGACAPQAALWPWRRRHPCKIDIGGVIRSHAGGKRVRLHTYS